MEEREIEEQKMRRGRKKEIIEKNETVTKRERWIEDRQNETEKDRKRERHGSLRE